MSELEADSMPQVLVDELWDYVNQFACPIAGIPHGDEREPPGDHVGTGWLVSRGGEPHLCTCEHVAMFEDQGTLGYAPFGGENGIAVVEKFERHEYPLDYAVANIKGTWPLIRHQGKCVPSQNIAQSHSPVPGEILYVFGFPGEDSKAAFSQHVVKPLGVLMHEVEAPTAVADEHPPFDHSKHICTAWNTAQAIPLTPDADVLSTPGGMSGSALWNTRYREITEAGGEWSVSDIQVTAIVWGASSKASVMVSTAIEHFRHYVT